MNQQTSPGQASNEELVQAIRAGDRTAAFELDQRWRPRLVGLAQSILHDDDLAQDVPQETLWRACVRYDGSSPFEPWILKVAGNLARDLLRERKRQPPIASDDEVLENVTSPSRPGIDALASQEEIEALEACKAGLSERSRTVVVLFPLGLSLSEIGEILRKPKTTVQAWLNKALEQLARCMAGKGFT